MSDNGANVIGIERELRNYVTLCNTIQLPIISSNDPSKGNLDESILENTQKIHQASITDRIIPDEMLTTAIRELES